MRRLLIGLAAISAAGCAPVAGNFCDVVTGPILFDRATSAQIVATDRPAAERISVINEYGTTACGWP